MNDYMADWLFGGTHTLVGEVNVAKLGSQRETLVSEGHCEKGWSRRDESELGFCEDSQGLRTPC